jgi:carbonic anhydrase
VATDNISQNACVEHVGRRTHPSLLSFSLSLLINTIKLFLISIPICIPILRKVVHLNVKVLIVMGHEGCGAIQAARLPQADINKESKCLCRLLTGLKEGLDEENLNRIKDHRAADREAVVTNVKKQVGLLMNNTVVKNSVDKNELIVVGAFYEMSSGIVDFYED